eukprot:Tbor_TRINITY_DN5446_c1_g1::TRINITY_DN5446_c1_g1_i1::g.25331::m.25331
MRPESPLRDRNLSGSPKRRREVENMGHMDHHSTRCGDLLVDIFRKKMQKLREKGGFLGLRLSLRLMDGNCNRQLSFVELAEGCNNFGLSVTPDDIEKLLKFLDKDSEGYMTSYDFIKGTRPAPSMRRQNLILKAYSILDKCGINEVRNSVSLEEMINLYDASSTPDVVAGKRTEEDVLEELKSGFEYQNVTRDEFMQYYADIGASIDDDDYFELMMRNGWHISGGEGNCRNTSCMRVIVTFMDTRQQIVEIKDDLRVKPGDYDVIKARLLAQGVDRFVNFEVLV